MSNEKVRQLLSELAEELKFTDLDGETSEMLEKLDSDIQAQQSDSITETEGLSTLEQAQGLEVKFAVNHPAAERLMQEVIDLLSKMGI